MSPRPSTGVRDRILEAAQRAFHEQGFHGTSLDDVLDRAAATKGGLYHHFADKVALGEAVVDERLRSFVRGRWGGDDWHGDPIGYLEAFVRGMHPDHLRLGCPVNSLAQEVAAHQEPLRVGLESVFDEWIAHIARGLAAGIEAGAVRPDIDPEAAATYFLAVVEGFLSIAKTKREARAFVTRSIHPLLDWLDTLRAPASP